MLDQNAAQEIPGDLAPADREEIAHTTAAVVVHRGRASEDPAVIDRLVRLVEDEGLDVVAGLWADAASNTLPGALWRLYVLRTWYGTTRRRSPSGTGSGSGPPRSRRSSPAR